METLTATIRGEHTHHTHTRTRSKGATDHRAEEGGAGPSGVGDSSPSHSRACKRARRHQSAEYVGDTPPMVVL